MLSVHQNLETSNDFPDEILVMATLNGDMDAFEELMVRYQKMVFKAAYRLMGQKEEAEDMVQEVFMIVYRKMHLFNPEKKFSSWLYRIAVNTCISKLRSRKNTIPAPFDDAILTPTEGRPQIEMDPQAFLEQKELRDEIWQAANQLPENYRIVLTLRYQMNLSNQEIADTLQIKKDNVEVRIHRARKALRQQLLKTEKGFI